MKKKEIPIIVSVPAATEILKEFQKWRRGEEKYDEMGIEMPYSPKIIGLAIDKAIDCMERISDLRLSCEIILDKTKL